MGVFRTNDPNLFDEIDGIVINEQTPPTQIEGIGSNVGILVGKFQRGPTDLSLPVGSIGEFQEIYGKSDFTGNKQLRNKAFGRLKIIRVVSDSAVKSTLTVDSKLTVKAKDFGAYGNNLSISSTDQTSSFTLIIKDKNPSAVLPIETYTGLTLDNVVSETAASKLVSIVVVDSATGNVGDSTETKLSGGSDGTVSDSDYQTAIAKAEVINAGNVIFLDENNSVKNGYLKAHVNSTQDKMAIVAGDENDTVSDTVTAAVDYRDTEGRIIYAYPWVQTTLNGSSEYTNPSAWMASVFTQTPSHVSLGRVQNARFLSGATGLKNDLTRQGFISLNEAGVSSFEQDTIRGVIIRNAVTTQIANTEKREILRRRMTDFLTNSVARALENYQNAVNNVENREEVNAMILEFDARLVRDGILPGSRDVSSGAPVLVDVKSLNTDAVIASGLFKIIYKRRIFSSMKYIVLQADIGTGVTITEGV